MRVLHLFDIGSFVHAGAVNKHSFIGGQIIKGADGFREADIQTGGLAQLLNAVYDIDPNETCVFCADRRPTIKQGMFPNYKANRDHKLNIEKQKEIIEIILKDIGYDVLAEEGYEADDLIYSCVQKFSKDYDFIHIWTGDSDLYFLVDEHVDIMPSRSNAKHVTRENYEHTVAKGKIVPYNCLTYNKIIGGDTSDNIPALSKEAQKTLAKLSATPGAYPNLGKKWYLDAVAEGVHPDFKKQLDLVFPLLTNTPTELVNHVDTHRLKMWGGIIRAKRYKYVSDIPTEYQAVIDSLIEAHLYEE